MENLNLSETAVKIIAGALAGAIATIGAYPLDFLHTRMAGNSKKDLRSILLNIRREGILSVTKGLAPSLIVFRMLIINIRLLHHLLQRINIFIHLSNLIYMKTIIVQIHYYLFLLELQFLHFLQHPVNFMKKTKNEKSRIRSI